MHKGPGEMRDEQEQGRTLRTAEVNQGEAGTVGEGAVTARNEAAAGDPAGIKG